MLPEKLNNNIQRYINLEKTITNLIEEIKISNFNNDTITKAKITLTLTIINTAIKAIPRIHKLFNFSLELEGKIFDDNKLTRDLSTNEAIELYQLANERAQSYISFVTQTLNSIRWNELEGILTILTRIESVKDDVDISITERAKEIINAVSEIKKENIDIIDELTSSIIDTDDEDSD